MNPAHLLTMCPTRGIFEDFGIRKGAFLLEKTMESIIVAIITGALSLLGVIITNMNSNRKIERQLEVSMAITNTKLEDLTKQVEKHNQVIERTYKLEQAVADIQRRG